MYDEVFGNIYDLKLRDVKPILIQVDDGLMTKNMLINGCRPNVNHLAFRNNFLFRLLLNIQYKVELKKFKFLLPESYKQSINNKNCEFINIRKKINNLSNTQYQEICEIFGFLPSRLKGKNILMLQPFFEDNLVSSIEYEIKMYKHILIAEGVAEENLYIKPHPRSTINYKKYFKNAEFIPKDFPYELLVKESNNNKFKKVMSIHSSGLEEFSTISDEVINFGTTEFSELEFTPMSRS
jgi:hypothetical protein